MIVDDGSHVADDQLATLANFFPALRQSGLYFIEDIGRGSPLYGNPRLVDRHTGGAPSFAVADDDGKSAMWKMIVICRLP